MVFFTCDACGESLKKAQVDKHLLKCRACHVLSCIDCGKDFRGDDYKNHIRCISEDQKYGGRDFQPKANKGDVKQQQWIERIQEAISHPGVDPKLQQILQKISAYENVPRKKAKFENWMRSCLKVHSPLVLKQIWEILSSAGSKQTDPQTASEQENRADLNNGTEEPSDTHTTKKKKRRREQDADAHNKRQKKSDEPSDESPAAEGEEPEGQESTGKFNWKGTIKAVLRAAPEDGLAVKKLRKKVLSAYYSFSGDTNFRSEEELLSLFNRKISSNPKFRILKDRVRLVK